TRIKDAIESAGINKKIVFSDPSKAMQWMSKDGGNFEIEIDGDKLGKGNHKIIKLHKRIEIKTDDK
ncbi:MAG: hypothetical protein R8L58_07690, partial [Mariprofundaceae bacterium]